MIYYVNAGAERDGNGSKQRPFKHIDDAARIAVAGDEILVAPASTGKRSRPGTPGGRMPGSFTAVRSRWAL